MAARSTPILFVLLISVTGVQSQITKGPTNALKKVDDSVLLECVTISKNCDQTEWVKMEGAQSPLKVYWNGIILDGFPHDRYSVSSSGGCNLTITQLKISDSGRFTCEQHIGGRQEIRGSVLVVINVTEECRSNVTSYALNQNDSYSFWTAIEVPDKSVEPSNVTLSFQNKAVDETETTDDQHPTTTIKTTLTGIAGNENITQRMCVASFPPDAADGFDRTTATLNVCITLPLIMSYPVENIAVSSGPYYKGMTVRCIADGHPYLTFQWTHLKSGGVVDGDILVINGEAGDEYTCTATNMVNGKPTSLNIMIEVFSPPPPGCGLGCITGIVGLAIIFIMVVIWLVGCTRGLWPVWFCLPCLSKKDDESRDIGNAGTPLTEYTPSS